MDWSFGVGFDPLDQAPALIAIVVGLLIWRRHPRDRRARVFLVLAASNLLLSIPLIAAAVLGVEAIGYAAVNGYIVSAGLLSAMVYLHFGLAFPHSRPWLRRGQVRWVYSAAVAAGLLPFLVEMLAPARQSLWIEGSFVGLGLAAFFASAAACVAIYRSYREMTLEERRTYRAPVIGVLAGMLAGIVMDAAIAVLFATVAPEANRYVLFTTNVLATAGELLLPLFFFMAAVKYRLLEHHSQDYVAKL